MGKKPQLILLVLLSVSFIFSQQTELIISGVDSHQVQEAAAVLKRAYENIGINVRFVYLPAERSISKANSGYYDGDIVRIEEVGSSYTNLLIIPVPIISIECVILSKNPNLTFPTWDSLDPYTIGIIRGIKIFEIRTKGKNVEIINSDLELLTLLIRERIDVAVYVRESTEFLLKNELKTDEVIIHEPPVEIIYLYHYLHKKHSDIIPLITKELQRMEQSGEIKEIIREQKNKS